MGRNQVGVLLLVAAICLGGWASTTWTSEKDKARYETGVAQFADAEQYGIDTGRTVPVDHTKSFVILGIGALLFLSGVIVLAASPVRRTDPAP